MMLFELPMLTRARHAAIRQYGYVDDIQREFDFAVIELKITSP